jgi:hypothetical protein
MPSFWADETDRERGLPHDSARTIATHGLRAEIEARHPKSRRQKC